MKNTPLPGVLAAVALSSLVLGSCGGGGTSTTDTSQSINTDSSWSWNLPVNFATPAVPDDNPMSEEKFQLGRRLFYDTRLSGNGTQSCASCHLQNLAFTDGKAVATGSTGCKGDPTKGVVTACTNPNRMDFSFAAFNASTQKIVLDLAELFKYSDLSHEGGGAAGCMSGTSDPECPGIFQALQINLANGLPINGGAAQTVFSVKSK